MKILYFGPARDCTGLGAEEIAPEDGMTVDRLWETLIERYPRLAECRPVSRIALDMCYVSGNEVISGATEIAIIPPVAGG